MSFNIRRLAALLSVALLAISATPVLAAAPGNDLFTGATPATIGFSEVLDTTEATTDSDDAQLNLSCEAPATDASVWYSFDGTGAGVIVDVSSSDYSAGVLVGVGSQGSLDTVACGPDTVAFFADLGTTYYVLAIDDQYDGGGNGGSLSISFNETPPPPTGEFTVDRYGTVNTRTGVATISGTYWCADAEMFEVDVEARQSVGRFTIQGWGSFFDTGRCDGTSHAWVADIYPDSGKFAGGKALTVTFAYACGFWDCAYGYSEQTVQLRGGRK